MKVDVETLFDLEAKPGAWAHEFTLIKVTNLLLEESAYILCSRIFTGEVVGHTSGIKARKIYREVYLREILQPDPTTDSDAIILVVHIVDTLKPFISLEEGSDPIGVCNTIHDILSKDNLPTMLSLELSKIRDRYAAMEREEIPTVELERFRPET